MHRDVIKEMCIFFVLINRININYFIESVFNLLLAKKEV